MIWHFPCNWPNAVRGPAPLRTLNYQTTAAPPSTAVELEVHTEPDSKASKQNPRGRPPPSNDPPILAADSSEELAGTPSGTPTQTPIAASLTAQKSLAIMQIIKILVELRRECLYKIIRNLDRKYWYTIFKRFRIYLNFKVIFLVMCWIYHLSQWNKPEFIYLRSWEWLPDVLRVVLSCRFIDILVFVFAASSCLAIKINKSFWTVAIVRLYENSAAISAKNFTNIKKKKTTELQIKT